MFFQVARRTDDRIRYKMRQVRSNFAYPLGYGRPETPAWYASTLPPPGTAQAEQVAARVTRGQTVSLLSILTSCTSRGGEVSARLGDASSDLRAQACDASDPRQGFSYDERTMLLRVQSDPTQCVTFVHSDAHGGCEPYTLAACDEADDHQKFVLEELRNSDPAVFQWHSVA